MIRIMSESISTTIPSRPARYAAMLSPTPWRSGTPDVQATSPSKLIPEQPDLHGAHGLERDVMEPVDGAGGRREGVVLVMTARKAPDGTVGTAHPVSHLEAERVHQELHESRQVPSGERDMAQAARMQTARHVWTADVVHLGVHVEHVPARRSESDRVGEPRVVLIVRADRSPRSLGARSDVVEILTTTHDETNLINGCFGAFHELDDVMTAHGTEPWTRTRVRQIRPAVDALDLVRAERLDGEIHGRVEIWNLQRDMADIENHVVVFLFSPLRLCVSQFASNRPDVLQCGDGGVQVAG